VGLSSMDDNRSDSSKWSKIPSARKEAAGGIPDPHHLWVKVSTRTRPRPSREQRKRPAKAASSIQEQQHKGWLVACLYNLIENE
jgi:hypothetical protein